MSTTRNFPVLTYGLTKNLTLNHKKLEWFINVNYLCFPSICCTHFNLNVRNKTAIEVLLYYETYHEKNSLTEEGMWTLHATPDFSVFVQICCSDQSTQAHLGINRSQMRSHICQMTGFTITGFVCRPQTSSSPPVISLLAVPRRLFCVGSLVILDVAYCYLWLFSLYINIKIGKSRC